MTRVITLASAGGSVVLGEASGVKAGLSMRGTGMPPVQVQWFEGAGEGRSFRGGRTLSRVLDMPVKVYGANREQVQSRLSLVARICELENAPITFTMSLDGVPWRLSVVRTGGGDWSWGEDTDGRTFAKIVLTVEAGRPYWERVDAEARLIKAGGLGIPLIGPGQSLVQLLVSNMEGQGSVTFDNSGDVKAWPIWTFKGPITGITAILGDKAFSWTGTLADPAQFVVVNTLEGTVTDHTGANRYQGLATAPKFWPIPPGGSTAQVTMLGATGATEATVVWHPRKSLVF